MRAIGVAVFLIVCIGLAALVGNQPAQVEQQAAAQDAPAKTKKNNKPGSKKEAETTPAGSATTPATPAGQAPKRSTAGPAQLIDLATWPVEWAESVLITCGVGDQVPMDWSGKVVATGAQVVRVRPWRFNAEMQVTKEAVGIWNWSCGTWLGPAPTTRPFDSNLPAQPQPVVQSGILIDVETIPGGKAGRLNVTTAQGNFEVPLGELTPTTTLRPLGGRVMVSRAVLGTPLAVRPSAEENDNTTKAPRDWHDYPSIAVSEKSGEVAVAFQTYSEDNGGDQVIVRRKSSVRPQASGLKSQASAWLAEEPLTDKPTAKNPISIYRTACAYDKAGELVITWAQEIDGNWDLYARRYSAQDNQGWRATERLTKDPQPDLHHVLVRDGAGDLWLVWQGFRNGQSEILARQLSAGKWSDEIRISTSKANDWQPAACAAGERGIVVVWDTYDQGNYDVRLRTVGGEGGNSLGKEIRVTETSALEARASVAVDLEGRAWVAYDTGGRNWGKDTGFELELNRAPQGTRLYEGRRLGMLAVDLRTGERLAVPESSLPVGDLNASLLEQLECPRLIAGGGNLYLVAQRRSTMSMSRRGVGRAFGWELLVSQLDQKSGSWSAPQLVADSNGRLDAMAGIAPDSDGLWLAWATDHRQLATNHPDLSSVLAGHFTAAPASDQPMKLKPYQPPLEKPSSDPAHANEPADVARVRGHRIEAAGKTYRILRGDMHRHTEHSSDGGGDGTLLDAYRYALDAAGMDFLLVTDHNDGSREYDWWRREKYNDLFQAGESFCGLCGYERSVSYPQGHRNVFFPQRGVRPLEISQREQGKGDLNSGEVLYPHLRKFGGICFSHTSATGMGTDWRDNDPLLEPLVEIFQGDRTNYEKLGAPWSADSSNPATQEGGFQPLGYVNLALAKGYKLGFQASSDHLSTHLSYSCILAERNTRESLFAAMQARHAYAATDNILLDVRSPGANGEQIMGDAFKAAGRPQLKVQIFGTAKLAEVVVVKDDRVVYSAEPNTAEFKFTYTDMQAEPGKESYYYVRAMQTDRRLAWGSPLWITAK